MIDVRKDYKMIFFGDLKKTIGLSLLGHVTIFSIFSFSFGYKTPKVNYVEVSFWGGILRASELKPYSSPAVINMQNFRNRRIKEIFVKKSDIQSIDAAIGGHPWVYGYYLKPAAFLKTASEKPFSIQEKTSLLLSHKKEVSAIMFYPSLPHHFLLYFKDRQLAHIELMFNIISGQKINPIVIKRKISSGNLEADLLSMRYISHYLFIQQAAFPSNIWQQVKIELSPKDDKY